MLKQAILLITFVFLFPVLAGCGATSTRESVRDARTPNVEQVATADLTRGWVQTAIPAATAAAPSATRVAATVVSPATPTRLPATGVTAITWSSFTSPKYGYVIAYPSEMTVKVENPGMIGDALEVERVVFKLPTYGPFGQSSAIAIEVAQRAYSRPVECQSQAEVIPGITGCRWSAYQPQATSQELVWFRVPASGQEYVYFSMQLIYDDLKYVNAFAHMLQTFKYSGAAATVTPPH